jgi:hypothetical protein
MFYVERRRLLQVKEAGTIAEMVNHCPSAPAPGEQATAELIGGIM